MLTGVGLNGCKVVFIGGFPDNSPSPKEHIMTTDMFGTSPAILDRTSAPKHGRRAVSLGIVATAAIALFLGGMGATASAAQTSGEPTTANAVVSTGITMTGITSNVTLTGAPGATVTSAVPVAYNVETNNVAGYAVTVGATAATLLPPLPLVNTDSIPITALTIREGSTGNYTPLSSSTPVPVHTQHGRSVDQGDLWSTSFEMRIPTVNADTYSTTLNYVATTL